VDKQRQFCSEGDRRMTIIDDRGRLFRRINVVDAAVGALVVLMLPIGYGAYMLFRPQPVRIDRVEPTVVEAGLTPKLKVSGANFRPFMRAQIGDTQLHTFAVDSPVSASADLPVLPPGKYPLRVYTEAETMTIVRDALTVLERTKPVVVTVRVIGAFVGLGPEHAGELKAGRRFPASGDPMVEVISVDPPRPDIRRLRAGDIWVSGRADALEVPAVVRAFCTVFDTPSRCRISDVPLVPGATVMLPGWGNLHVDEIRGDGPAQRVDIEVKFLVSAEKAAIMKVGDTDSTLVGDPYRARLVQLGNRQSIVATMTDPIGAGMTVTQVQQPMIAMAGTVRAPANEMPVGLDYRGQSLKVGLPFVFETSDYLARGTIVRVTRLRD
jgi:hypothetical protein